MEQKVDELRDAIHRTGFDGIEDLVLRISPLRHHPCAAIDRFNGECVGRVKSTFQAADALDLVDEDCSLFSLMSEPSRVNRLTCESMKFQVFGSRLNESNNQELYLMSLQKGRAGDFHCVGWLLVVINIMNS